jgi:septum formation protein
MLDSPLLAADTVLDLDGRTGGKPRDLAEAHEMLASLSGRTHDVVTAVALGMAGGQPEILTSRSTVHVKPLTTEVIQHYFRLVNPLDKAGAYGIQEHGDMLIDHVDGSISNVIGLPLEIVIPWLQSIFPDQSVHVPDIRDIWENAPEFTSPPN